MYVENSNIKVQNQLMVEEEDDDRTKRGITSSQIHL